MNNVYFGEEGLNSTSANYYANMAQELIQSTIDMLNNIRLYDTNVSSLDSQSKQLMSKGWDSLEGIKEKLDKIGKMNAFCAWVREAIKEKDLQLNKLTSLSLEAWMTQTNYPVMEVPDRPEPSRVPSEEDIISTWDINKRNKYLRLEAFASTYGKFIHPKGSISKARKDLANAISNPITKEGSGRDLILYYHESTVNLMEIDSLFMELQGAYRSYEKELNAMKAELKEEVNKEILRINQEYKKQLDEYNAEYDKWMSYRKNAQVAYNNWITSERERISKLKIVLPSDLMETFQKIKKQCDSSK